MESTQEVELEDKKVAQNDVESKNTNEEDHHSIDRDIQLSQSKDGYFALPGAVAQEKSGKDYLIDFEEFLKTRLLTAEGWLMNLYYMLPVSYWLPRYKFKEWIRGDIMAGLTVGVMLVPQGMAYASIAELPPIYGLYSALIPLIAYFMFGTSGQLAVGPVAIVSILVAEGLKSFVDSKEDPERYIHLAIFLGLLVGVIQALFGFLRLGFVVTVLSPSVITGFSTASALIIGTSQLKDLFGVSIPRTSDFFTTLYYSFAALGKAQWLPIVMGLTSIAVIMLLQRWKPRIPWSLLVVIIDTVIAFLVVKYTSIPLPIVNKVPAGLPSPSVPSIENSDDIVKLLPIAFLLSLVGFMESISVAQKFAEKHQVKIDANQELVALGFSNVFGSFFKSYPVTGGFSRTAVNDNAGSKTPLSSLVSALVILLALVLLTPLFTYIPKCSLAAIIIVAIIKLVEVGRFKKLWRVKKGDFLVALVTFFVTLGAGVEIGIGVGVGVSLLIIIYESTRPHTAELGSIQGKSTTHFRNIRRYPNAKVYDHIVICRVDSSLYFANSQYVSDQIDFYLSNSPSKKPTKFLILECTTINSIDFAGSVVLKKLGEKLEKMNIKLLMAGVKGPVSDVIRLVHLDKQFGDKSFFFSVSEATEAALSILATEEKTQEQSPLDQVV